MVSITTAAEYLSKGDKIALKEFMTEIGAKVGKNGGSSSQVKSLQDKATRMGRKVGKGDASIISGAKNNNATVITIVDGALSGLQFFCCHQGFI